MAIKYNVQARFGGSLQTIATIEDTGALKVLDVLPAMPAGQLAELVARSMDLAKMCDLHGWAQYRVDLV